MQLSSLSTKYSGYSLNAIIFLWLYPVKLFHIKKGLAFASPKGFVFLPEASCPHIGAEGGPGAWAGVWGPQDGRRPVFSKPGMSLVHPEIDDAKRVDPL